MGTRGVEIVCFHGRNYINCHQYDSFLEGLGAMLVKRIPEKPAKYKRWLASMRAKYAAMEQMLEHEVYTLRPVADKAAPTEGPWPIQVQVPHYSSYNGLCEVLPVALPSLDNYNGNNVYIVNLDAEVLTMNYSLHWRMDRIPRADRLWLAYTDIVDLNTVPASCMASLAVPLPARDGSPMRVQGLRHQVTLCDAHTQLDGRDKVWRVLAATGVGNAYHRAIGRFGRQWYPQDLPFRELVFALVSLAAGRQTAFCSFSTRREEPCSSFKAHHPRHCDMLPFCEADHLSDTPGWVHPRWFAGGAERLTKTGPALLLDFCSPLHWEGQAPGAAPAETTYWITDDVLVHLTLAVDGTAVAEAMEWGRAQRRAKSQGRDAGRFYMVVLSLFNVVFAEVFEPEEKAGRKEDDRPDMRLSAVLPLSRLNESEYLSHHPRERPVMNDDSEPGPHDLSVEGQQRDFPGTVAMVNFFAAIDSRRATAATAGAARPNGRLPAELYAQILDLVDYATWQTCLLVSPLLRALGLSRYRLDDRYALVGEPGQTRDSSERPKMTFALRDLATGQTETVVCADSFCSLGPSDAVEYEWMPVLGSGTRQAVMLEAPIKLKPLVEDRKRKEQWDEEHWAVKRSREEREETAAAGAGASAT